MWIIDLAVQNNLLIYNYDWIMVQMILIKMDFLQVPILKSYLKATFHFGVSYGNDNFFNVIISE